MTTAVNYIVSVLTVLTQIFIIFLIWAKLVKNSAVERFVTGKVLALSFIVALGATLGSLFYSEVAGYEPCLLCWWQRIFMFPLVFILGVALTKKDYSVKPYIRTLTIVGALIAGYQSLLQMGLLPSIVCPAAAVSCAQRYFLTFGYITLPLMGFTAFLLLITISLFWKKHE